MEAVYESWDQRLVRALGHGPSVHYRIFIGTVNWDRTPDTLQRAIVVFMQYGSEADWTEANRLGEISFKMPAHVLLEDVSAVTSAVLDLQRNYP